MSSRCRIPDRGERTGRCRDKPLAGISILLAEDDEINQMMLQVNLDRGRRRPGDGRRRRKAAVERVISDGPGRPTTWF
jgi:hypothetical protein